MAEKLSLRDYQRDLAQRLRAAEGTRVASLLALQVGQEGWLVDLADAGEVLPVPAITPVPLTKGWFRGMANIRGNLYSVVDFAAFLGGPPAVPTEQARLLLLGERFRVGSALLVDRSLGLRNPAQLKAGERPEAAPPWLKAMYLDEDGRAWKELDVPQLVLQPEYLTVGA
ncbi:MAG TPA: chemotaxis protein CheW [Burkholderiales bacterium]|nr:chemotaxis protein CheW [Burkholderiales bacterium]